MDNFIVDLGIIIGENSRNLLSLDEYEEHFLVPFSPRFRNIDFAVSSLSSIGISEIAVFAIHDKDIILNYLAVSWPRINFHVFDFIDIKYKFAGFIDDFQKEKGLNFIAIIKGNFPAWFDLNQMLPHIGKSTAICASSEYGSKPINPCIIIDRHNLMENHDIEGDFFNENSLNSDIILKIINALNVEKIMVDGYITPFKSLKEYYDIHIGMLDKYIEFDLLNSRLPIKGSSSANIISNFGKHSHIINSIAGENVEINGKIENSIIFSNVKIERNSHIKNSLILPGNHIGQNSVIINSIIDEYSGDNTLPNIDHNSVIGREHPVLHNETYPDILDFGVTLVGKDSHIPHGARIGGNCFIDSFLPLSFMKANSKLSDGMSVIRDNKD